MDPQGQTTSLQRLHNVENRIVRVLELAGGVMEEMASPSGPRKGLANFWGLRLITNLREYVEYWQNLVLI
ncbi:hypothetical protein ACS0TY_002886 [Phlomoides rotata]